MTRTVSALGDHEDLMKDSGKSCSRGGETELVEA